MKNEYDLQAANFAKKHNVKLTVIGEPEYKRYFTDDKEYRYVFKLRLSRNGKKYTFSFGQSINSGAEEPGMYDVLTCLTKYDPETFEDFCYNYGYDIDSRKAEKTYEAVCKEWNAVNRLFPESEVMEELREIN
jgi:hypothetical protein